MLATSLQSKDRLARSTFPYLGQSFVVFINGAKRGKEIVPVHTNKLDALFLSGEDYGYFCMLAVAQCSQHSCLIIPARILEFRRTDGTQREIILREFVIAAGVKFDRFKIVGPVVKSKRHLLATALTHHRPIVVRVQIDEIFSYGGAMAGRLEPHRPFPDFPPFLG